MFQETRNNIWIVIAAYNEGRMIGDVVRSVRAVNPQATIVVVDDCSRDDTSRQARNAGAEVLRHPVNRGQGAALRTGFSYALSGGADVVVTFDADGQMDPSDIAAVISPVIRGEVDVVLGSRFLAASATNASPVRRAALRVAVMFTRVLSGLRLTDTHNGFRALSRHALSVMRLSEDRMAHASEILHEIARTRLTYTEVPVTVRYTDYSRSSGRSMGGGQSTLSAVRLGFRVLWTTFFQK